MAKEIRRRRHRHRPAHRAPPGTAPGSLTTNPHARPSLVHVMGYGPQGLEEEKFEHLDRVPGFLKQWPVTWINVDGLGNTGLLEQLGQLFGLHALALEDIVHVHQRAKVEQYGEQLFIVVRRAAMNAHLESEQVSIVLGRNFVLTFEAGIPGDCFEPVRDRLRSGRGELRGHAPDHLVHAIIDAAIDSYFPVLEHYGERLDLLDDQIGNLGTHNPMHEIHLVRGELLFLRRVIWPHREALVSLTRDPHPLVSEGARVYLRDCYDHTIQIIDLLQSYREVCTDLRDYHLSAVSNRTNEIMKVLTIISTIFMPLTFIAGVYGMNFKTEVSPYNMPELSWRYGYPLCWLLMGLSVVGLLVFFRRKGWLGGASGAAAPSTHRLDHGPSATDKP